MEPSNISSEGAKDPDDETMSAPNVITVDATTKDLSSKVDTPPASNVPMNNDASNAITKDESSKSIGNSKPQKIKVHLVAVGSAPILKKSKFLMNADDRFVVAIAFLRKILKLSSSSSSLFLYVNAAFVPCPDERMGDLFDCFGSRGELVIHYSLQEAWG